MKYFIFFVLIISCEQKQASAPSKTGSQMAKEVSPEGFNWIHYDFAKIYSGTILEHGLRGVVRIERLKERLPELKKYLETHKQISYQDFQKWPTPQRLAFLLNTYHGHLLAELAVTKDLSTVAKVFVKPETVEVFSHKYSLDEFAKTYIEEKEKDHRLLFSLKCFDPTCPELRNTIYNYKNVEKLLDINMKRFFMDKKKFRLNENKKSVKLPSIFSKFDSLKKFSDDKILNLLRKHSESEKIKKLIGDNKLKLFK